MVSPSRPPRTRRGASQISPSGGPEELAEKLAARGYATAALNGDIPQKQRESTIDKLKGGKIDILVATDVAGRGLHIEDVTHVINYSLPEEPEDYVHRIGRTARAGASGSAISFACEDYAHYLVDIEEYIGHRIDNEPIDYDSLREVGAIMGSGGMIVMDDTSCMVDVAKFFQDFSRDESCGKCTPCRVGTSQMYMLLDQITKGEATEDDLAQLERLAGIVALQIGIHAAGHQVALHPGVVDPGDLSGGECQRVFIARAICQAPQIILLDEPMSSIDTPLRDDLRRLLRKINKRGMTIMHVTHDYREAIRLAAMRCIGDPLC